jgi:TolA-binding protein
MRNGNEEGMSTRKVTRHEMKHDEFVTGVGQATIWIEEHWPKVVAGLGGVVVLGLLVYGGWVWRTSKAMAGEAALSGVETAFSASVGAGDAPHAYPTVNAKYGAVKDLADAVIAGHGSTPAGERARYYRALALFEMGDLAGARADLQAFVDRNPSHFLAGHAQRKIAETYEREANYGEACERYRKLGDAPPPGFPVEAVLFDLARCESERGKPQEAAAACRRIVTEFPDCAYVSDARALLTELGLS